MKRSETLIERRLRCMHFALLCTTGIVVVLMGMAALRLWPFDAERDRWLSRAFIVLAGLILFVLWGLACIVERDAKRLLPRLPRPPRR